MRRGRLLPVAERRRKCLGSGVPAEGLDFDGALRGATCGWVSRGRHGNRPFLTGVF